MPFYIKMVKAQRMWDFTLGKLENCLCIFIYKFDMKMNSEITSTENMKLNEIKEILAYLCK